MLDRCFITYEIATSNNKKLILINTHNSAFDGTGNLPKSELAFLREYMQREYNNGNYVILGGDFNLAPITFTKDDFNLILEVHQELYGKRPILFLDEVQNVEGWEKFARRLADNKYRVCITGSNAK
ncbi:MAG: AAA family ATPase, partial [Paludibacteraceae bacterium]|nr:AAA family ATPase [Paludibacteraceae bacterium]